MNILALDLGTHTGYAYTKRGEFYCGTWDLATPEEVKEWGKTRMTRRADPRICRFLKHISSVGPVDAIVFEDVQFSSSTYQTQLWAGLRSCVWFAACQDAATLLECVPTGTLKKFATGHGAATKEMMADSLVKQDPRFTFKTIRRKQVVHDGNHRLDDNAIDAIWLWRWATHNLGRIL